MTFVQMIQYLTLILKSYSEGREFFINNLIREQEEARKDDLVSIIDDVKFFYNCQGVVEILEANLDRQYRDKEMESDDEVNIYDLTLNLNDFTNNHLHGTLKMQDLDFMEIAITIAGRYVNYLERKQFGFKKLQVFWGYYYRGFLRELKSFKISFDVIKNKLPPEQSFEFVNDFLDQLKELEQLQNIGKFKLLIKNTIADIQNENAELLGTSSLSLEQNQKAQQPNKDKTEEVYKNQNLFKVGLLFAKGELNQYFKVNARGETIMNNGFSAAKIAKALGNDSYNKWILASINNYATDNPNGNKNIFNSLDMMNKIFSHCEVEKIPVDPYFKSRIPSE